VADLTEFIKNARIDIARALDDPAHPDVAVNGLMATDLVVHEYAPRLVKGWEAVMALHKSDEFGDCEIDADRETGYPCLTVLALTEALEQP